MGYPHGMKALQLADHFRTASGHEVLLLAANHLTGVLRDTGCTQVGQFDLRRVSAYTSTVAFQSGKLMRILFNCARIEIPPVRPASDYRQHLLFTPATDEQRNGGMGARLTVGIANAVVFPYEGGRARGPQGLYDDGSFF